MRKTSIGVVLFLTMCSMTIGAVGCSDDPAVRGQEQEAVELDDAGAATDARQVGDDDGDDAPDAAKAADAATEDAPTVKDDPVTAKDDTYDVLVLDTLTTTATAPHCDAYEPLETDGVLANDCAPSAAPLSVTLVSGPANAASFELNSDGSFVYVASGDASVDSFTYSVSNGATSATAKASITVRSCTSTLQAHGCQFIVGPSVWDCGSKDLQGADLSGCSLPGASFFNANLTGAKLHRTDLTGANFFSSTVTSAKWKDTTCPAGANSNANGNTCCGAFILGQTLTGC